MNKEFNNPEEAIKALEHSPELPFRAIGYLIRFQMTGEYDLECEHSIEPEPKQPSLVLLYIGLAVAAVVVFGLAVLAFNIDWIL